MIREEDFIEVGHHLEETKLHKKDPQCQDNELHLMSKDLESGRDRMRSVF